MRLGIDASNIRAGGGLTHLVQLLRADDPRDHGIDNVTVWSGLRTLDQIRPQPWLLRSHHVALDGGLVSRLRWQRVELERLAHAACDVLFVPGGSYLGSFRPFVAMSQSLLPFDSEARRRYGSSRMRLKLEILKRTQSATFRQAAGVVFLTELGRKQVMRTLGDVHGRTIVIPHGVSEQFPRAPKPQHPLSEYSVERPFRWLYVSSVDYYKHQPEVVRAVSALRSEGLPVALDLIGEAYPPALSRLKGILRQVDPRGEFIRYHGGMPHEKLAEFFHGTDGFIFASSCETFGIILLEAMAAGLPIACSSRSVMPEVLGSDGAYFDPEDPGEIGRVLRELMADPDMRYTGAASAYRRAQTYTWKSVAEMTFKFIAAIGPSRRCSSRISEERHTR